MQMQRHRTTSLNAAAFLIADGHPLVDAVRDDDGRIEFVIGGDRDAIASRLHEYQLGSAVVNALRFSEALRRLKAVIHGLD